MAKFKDVLEIVREDDFVEYFVFQNNINVGQLNNVDSLANIESHIQTIICKYQKGYIWQKDEFNLIIRNTSILHPVDDNEEILPPHLYGVTHYGDNIEDEWFIVFLLVQITKEMPGVIARVIDSDGEFLLIEAADFLPKWATPETSDKRVYIYNGEVHIVPISKLKDDEDEQITVPYALQRIISQPELTRANANIQKAVKARIEGYPEKIKKNLHHANLYVPAAVAALLKEKPSLVAAAVTAFSYRDPIDMRACRIMRYFPPETRVMCQVTFTKCLYAMLVHQKYVPDRRTGWNVPLPNSPLYKAHSFGVKLACGFEILASQYKTADNNNDITTDRMWHKYKQSLVEKGYFKDLLEGSQEYISLEAAAQEYFKSCATYSQPPTGKIVLDLIKNLEYDIEELKAEGNSLPPPDDDSWLNICPEELEQMMRERYGNKSSTGDITSNLSNFLNHVSGLEGAEFPNEQLMDSDAPPVRPKRGIKPRKSIPNSDVPADDDDDSNKIHFDHESFSCAVQNILDFVVPDDSWDLESDESGMSSYEDESEMDLGKHQKGQSDDTPVSELKQYMDQMDRELSTTTMGKSFHLAQPKKKGMEDSFSDIENFEPVDIDMNALKNILESYQAQMGSAGPASNMLGPMGVRLDKMDKE